MNSDFLSRAVFSGSIITMSVACPNSTPAQSKATAEALAVALVATEQSGHGAPTRPFWLSIECRLLARWDIMLLASGSNDDTIKLWDVAGGREWRTLEGNSNAVTSVAFSPDGAELASGSQDRTIKLWGIELAD